jgi:hypothetical protein
MLAAGIGVAAVAGNLVVLGVVLVAGFATGAALLALSAVVAAVTLRPGRSMAFPR